MSVPKIKLTKCDPNLVRKTLDDLGLDTEGTTKAIVDRLAEFYTVNAARFNIAGCNVCDADSDADLPQCPFCGTDDEEGDEEGDEEEG